MDLREKTALWILYFKVKKWRLCAWGVRTGVLHEVIFEVYCSLDVCAILFLLARCFCFFFLLLMAAMQMTILENLFQTFKSIVGSIIFLGCLQKGPITPKANPWLFTTFSYLLNYKNGWNLHINMYKKKKTIWDELLFKRHYKKNLETSVSHRTIFNLYRNS